jgi:iron-sulfur cluster assembly protein
MNNQKQDCKNLSELPDVKIEPKKNRPPILTISDAAVKKMQELMEKKPKCLGIKVKVKSGGCSGLSYAIEYAETVGSFDEKISTPQGIDVYIDPKAIMYLIGTKMDYIEEQFKSGFVFTNPNEKGKCGCGQSFHV